MAHARKVKHAITIQGLLEAEPGQVLNDIFALQTSEEAILWKYSVRSPDAVSLMVNRYCALERSVDVHSTSGGRAVSTRFDVFVPGPDLTDSRFSGGRSLDTVLQSWGYTDRRHCDAICYLLIVAPIAELVCQGRWSTAVVQGAGERIRDPKFREACQKWRRQPSDVTLRSPPGDGSMFDGSRPRKANLRKLTFGSPNLSLT